MSTSNVTPIRDAGNEPPKPPGKRRALRQKPELRFGSTGEGPCALIIWQGLRAVCKELDAIDTGSVDRYIRLAAAAAVLAELLENRIV